MYSVTALMGTAFAFSRCNPKSTPTTSVTSCDDYSGLSEDDLKTRKNLGYVEETPMEDRQCQNCNLYLPPEEENPCGGCALFKGPVFPEAYCTYWAPQV